MIQKKIIISNLFNNLDLPKEIKNLWELQYKNLAEKCNADFDNFSVNDNGNISKHYMEMLSCNWPQKLVIKINQLSLLDKLDECFEKGYEWVFAMDADIVINSDTNFNIEKCNKNVVYFASVDKDLLGKQLFSSNIKDTFLKKYSLKYGNQGVLLISNVVWNIIKDKLRDHQKITKYSKPNKIKGFLRHIDQNILSIALTLKNIEIEKIPNKDNLFLHFVGEHIQRYKDAYKIDDTDFNCLREKFLNSIDTKISNKHLTWFPLLFHYLNLTANEKQKLFKGK